MYWENICRELCINVVVVVILVVVVLVVVVKVLVVQFICLSVFDLENKITVNSLL